ncbi:MAG: hypothetical protein ACRD3W_18750, partial [Terriglobales bacterium]
MEDASWSDLLKFAGEARDKSAAGQARNLVKRAARAASALADPDEKRIAVSICEGMLASLRKRFMRAELMLQVAVTAASKADAWLDLSIARLALVELGTTKLMTRKYSQAAHCFEKALELFGEGQQDSREGEAVAEKLVRARGAMRKHTSDHKDSNVSATDEIPLDAKMHIEQVLGIPF